MEGRIGRAFQEGETMCAKTEPLKCIQQCRDIKWFDRLKLKVCTKELQELRLYGEAGYSYAVKMRLEFILCMQ